MPPIRLLSPQPRFYTPLRTVRHNSTYARARHGCVSNHRSQRPQPCFYTPLQVRKTGDISGHKERSGTQPQDVKRLPWLGDVRLTAMNDRPEERTYRNPLAFVDQGVTLRLAAGVDRTTHYGWMKNDPEYRKSFESLCRTGFSPSEYRL